MDSPPTLSALLLLSSLFPLLNNVAAELVLEEGYTVTTAIDGHKHKINPYSVLPFPASPHLLVLDSVASSFFTLSVPLSQGSSVERVAGDVAGKPGFADGEPGSALFNRPRSFAVDLRGNVYVADKANHAIRKITNIGGAMVRVVTIAGGRSKDQQGHQDGPAQNATFSSDFELVFVPEMCALLVSDHGNQLVRQIGLKPEDCAKESPHAFGATPFLVLAMALSCVIGIVIGIAIHPYIIPHEGFRPANFTMTWKRCLMNLAKQIPQMHCFGIRSATANSRLCALFRRLVQLCLSHISLMFMFKINSVSSQGSNNACVSLIDSDVNSSGVEKPQMYVDQLKDLINFGGDLQLLNSSEGTLAKGDDTSRCDLPGDQGSVENMILANIEEFSLTTGATTQPDGSLPERSVLVKRRGSGRD